MQPFGIHHALEEKELSHCKLLVFVKNIILLMNQVSSLCHRFLHMIEQGINYPIGFMDNKVWEEEAMHRLECILKSDNCDVCRRAERICHEEIF